MFPQFLVTLTSWYMDITVYLALLGLLGRHYVIDLSVRCIVLIDRTGVIYIHNLSRKQSNLNIFSLINHYFKDVKKAPLMSLHFCGETTILIAASLGIILKYKLSQYFRDNFLRKEYIQNKSNQSSHSWFISNTLNESNLIKYWKHNKLSLNSRSKEFVTRKVQL